MCSWPCCVSIRWRSRQWTIPRSLVTCGPHSKVCYVVQAFLVMPLSIKLDTQQKLLIVHKLVLINLPRASTTHITAWSLQPETDFIDFLRENIFTCKGAFRWDGIVQCRIILHLCYSMGAFNSASPAIYRPVWKPPKITFPRWAGLIKDTCLRNWIVKGIRSTHRVVNTCKPTMCKAWSKQTLHRT